MGYTKFSFKAPVVQRYYVYGTLNYAKPHVIAQNLQMISRVSKDYAKIIDKWAKIFDIDSGIIICFICTESGGINAPKNRYDAKGLMQVTPNTVYETITKWNNEVKVPLSAETKAFFNKKVPSTSSWNSNRNPSDNEKTQILSALSDEEYNIALGTANIRWLIEAFSKTGNTGIDKVMVAYNSGYYGSRNKIKNLTATEIVNAKGLFSFETRAYVLKMLGTKGFMDLYYTNEKKKRSEN